MTTYSIWKGALKYRQGRAGHDPEYICVHIMDGTLIGTDAWFNNPLCQASAHSGVGSKGEVHDYVHSVDTAFHAGVVESQIGTWKHFKRTASGILINPNFYTLGLENEGHPGKEISQEAYEASAGKCKFWHERFGIPIIIDRYVNHSEIYPGHNCPGGSINVEKLVALVKTVDPIYPSE